MFSSIIAAVDALKNSRSFGTYTSMCQHVNDGKAVFRQGLEECSAIGLRRGKVVLEVFDPV
jgi:hypothetical protein